IPMARGLGLGVLAWGPLGAGVLSGKYTRPAAKAGQRRLADVDPGRLAIAQAVADVADGLGLSSPVVALAWLRAQGGVIPILGARPPPPRPARDHPPLPRRALPARGPGPARPGQPRRPRLPA